MASKTLIKNDGQLARPLKVLVPLIKEEIHAGDEAGLEHYRKAGEMLLEAKGQVPHGEFMTWATRICDRSQATVNNWMALARKTRAGAHFKTLSHSRGDTRPPGRAPEWLPEMKDRIDRLKLEKLSKPVTDEASREKLKRKLALDIIDIGYRALSTKLHPDKGGSREAMATLNDARDDLKGAVSDW